MLVRVEKDGPVREVFLCATTKINRCLCKTHAEGHAFAPPTPAHWVDVFRHGARAFFVVVYLAAHQPGIGAR